MNNKEIIEKLIDYFNDQDKAVVSRLCANFMIDFNRIEHMASLPSDEKKCLLQRIRANNEALRDFIKNGPKHKLIVGKLE